MAEGGWIMPPGTLLAVSTWAMVFFPIVEVKRLTISGGCTLVSAVLLLFFW
jgi:hypothetical protein